MRVGFRDGGRASDTSCASGARPLHSVNELVAGDWVVQEFTFTGTHTGTLTTPDGDIPPTNRSATGRGVQIMHVENGKISQEHLYFDQVELLTQLGLMPQPATA